MFSAFISCSRKDRRLARRLHRTLDKSRTPRALRGRATPLGTVPRRLARIFFDRDERATAPGLAAPVARALERSEQLIVLCSPHAAASNWVNEEILAFKRLGRGERIHAVVLDGEPPHCFPPALQFSLAPDGTVCEASADPLSTDLRQGGEGWAEGLWRLRAGLLGVDAGELRRCEAARRRVCRRRLVVTVVSLALLLAGAGLAAVSGWRDAETRSAVLDRAVSFASGAVGRAVEAHDRLPGAVIGGFLGAVQAGLDRLLAQDAGNAALRVRYARLVLDISRHFRTVGRGDRAIESARVAGGIFSSLGAADARNTGYRGGLIDAWIEEGHARLLAGDAVAAATAFDHVRAAVLPEGVPRRRSEAVALRGPPAEALRGAADPARTKRGISAAPRDMSLPAELVEPWARAKATVKLADVALSLGRLGEASGWFAEAQDILQDFSARPADAAVLARYGPVVSARLAGDLAAVAMRIGDVHRRSGRPGLALDAYDAAWRGLAPIAERDPRSRDFRHAAAAAQARRGLALDQLERLEEAVATLAAAVGELEALSRQDPDNGRWRRDLHLALGDLGEALGAQGELARSRDMLRRAETVARDLARRDPDDPVWAHDVAVARLALALAALRAGDKPAAVSDFRGAAAVLADLAGREVRDAAWLRELAAVRGALALLLPGEGG